MYSSIQSSRYIQNTEKTTVENQVDRVDMPEATFAATPVPNDEINRGPSPTPEPETNADVKDELKIEPILYEDFAWEKNLVEPGDYLIKIAKREYGDFLDEKSDNHISLINPLSNDTSILRKSLIYGAVEVLKFNHFNGNHNGTIFEWGKVYFEKG